MFAKKNNSKAKKLRHSWVEATYNLLSRKIAKMIIHVFIIYMLKGVLLSSIIDRNEYIQAINEIVMTDAMELTDIGVLRNG